MPRHPVFAVVVVLVVATACTDNKSEPSGARPAPRERSAPPPISKAYGNWRGVLASAGGDLPFGFRMIRRADGVSVATIFNASERIADLPVTIDGDRVVISFPHYDATITATLEGSNDLTGAWVKTTATGKARLPFSARKGQMFRFEPVELKKTRKQSEEVKGSWRVTFVDDDGETLARGELERQGPVMLRGTFLTPTGDYRYLDGDYINGQLRLSTFDGAHAFLFTATVDADGMKGDFWSGDKYHASFTGNKIEGTDKVLPDPFNEVRVTSKDGRFRFSFPDHATGEVVTSEDPRFAGKVLLVDVFGSWCPNCNDMAPVLVDFQRRFGDKGLAVVGLAFEYSGDAERDRRVLASYVERHKINFPILLAGVSDKQKATEALPDVSEIKAYPTTIFIGRRGKVRKIHSGFAGPGTGDHHGKLLVELATAVTSLLEEKAR